MADDETEVQDGDLMELSLQAMLAGDLAQALEYRLAACRQDRADEVLTDLFKRHIHYLNHD